MFNLQISWSEKSPASNKVSLNPESRIVFAPNPYIKTGATLFLSGCIDQPPETWRATLSAALAHLPITILDPVRTDWDSSWRETPSFAPFKEQVDWELEGLEKADVVAIYFGETTQSPITLMELGLSAKSGKCVVACPEGYGKRANVQIVCARYGIQVLDSVGDLADAVVRKLRELGKL